jgi:mRNA interferase MazF
VLVISADTYNTSRLATVLAVVITSNTDLATMPGNVFLPAAATGLPKDSVVNVTAVVTLNKADLSEQAGQAPLALLREIDRGLRHVLDLWSINARTGRPARGQAPETYAHNADEHEFIQRAEIGLRVVQGRRARGRP